MKKAVTFWYLALLTVSLSLPLRVQPFLSNTTLITEDNTRLAVTSIVRPGAQRIVVICHGLGDSKNLIKIFANLFPHDTLIAHDFRGHGNSKGKTTFGINEYKDVQTVLNYVHTHNSDKKPVFGIGISMGGASLMKAIAHGSYLDGIVIDSAYCNLYETVHNKANQSSWFAWIPRFLQNPLIRSYCGGDTHSVNITSYGNKITIPVLIFHDTQDSLIPYTHALTIQTSIPGSVLKTTHAIPHACICGYQPVLYTQDAEAFFNRIQNNK